MQISMNPLNRLRFKIVTSFAIAAFGVVAAARLASHMPFSSATVLPFLILALLVSAGLWRGFIFLQAVRDPAKTYRGNR
jgi:hypothetical protein